MYFKMSFSVDYHAVYVTECRHGPYSFLAISCLQNWMLV